MKKMITLLSFALISIFSSAQITHTLTANDNYFVPDTLYIAIGDTVEMINNGYHSSTEVDSLDWVNNTATHNGGFYVGFGAPTSYMKYAINQAGTFYNICVPHAGMGMKSIIIVGSGTSGIEDNYPQLETYIYPNPSDSEIAFQPTTTVKIYDAAGRLILEKSNPSKMNSLDISTFSTGIYTLVSDNGIRKFIKN
jgi:plastocyanin